MSILEWLSGLLALVLLAAALVALVRLVAPVVRMRGSRAVKIAVVVFALLGAIVISSAMGLLPMHLGMSMMGCCGES